MKLENAELKHIERIAAISKAAFDSDIHVGAPEAGGPPDYDSIPWHIQMKNEGHDVGAKRLMMVLRWRFEMMLLPLVAMV